MTRKFRQLLLISTENSHACEKAVLGTLGVQKGERTTLCSQNIYSRVVKSYTALIKSKNVYMLKKGPRALFLNYCVGGFDGLIL